MTKKRISIELSDTQYRYLLKIIGLGEFVLQAHKLRSNTQITQMLDNIFSYSKQFGCEDMIDGPFKLDNSYEINPDMMSELIDECFDLGQIAGEEEGRFMLKAPE